MPTLTVDLTSAKDRSYSITIESGLLSRAGELIAQRLSPRQVFIVSDDNVWPLYGQTLIDSLANQGIQAHHLVLPAGEASKSLAALERIYDALASSHHLRHDPILALGGGVVGDVTGLAAATYMRGVPFVQIPTTLLAQVDSSVGGKVAVNLISGKNMVGAFYQPELVISDTAVLSSLSDREFSVGMAEVIKHAALFDPQMLAELEQAGGRAGVMANIDEIVRRNCDHKRRLVAADEEDRGERMLLNFGHTFGHAIEKAGNYAAHTHGEAVAIGMALAARASKALGVSQTPLSPRLIGILQSYDLPTSLPYPWDSIAVGMAGDKKNSGDGITLILLEDFGKPVIRKVSFETLQQLGDAIL